MDLSKFDVVAAAQTPQMLALNGPHGKPLLYSAEDGEDLKGKPVMIPVLSLDNEAVLQAGREFDREHAKEKETLPDPDYARMRRGVIAAAAVPEWPEKLRIAGKPLTPGTAAQVLGTRSFSWIADQVIMFGGFRGNYFRAVLQD